jgi:asparagine synthase (glutamine-hydrolysing)
MSTLGGIYNFDGSPVDSRDLAALGNSLSSRGPDGGGDYQRGSLGMVYRAFHTNIESRLETQPLISPAGHVLCWDGRLDNRDDLLPLLHNELAEDCTDVAIALAAYRKWGFDFLPRLIGDFALALWVPHIQTVLLARDQAGPRPLFYYPTEDRIVWASELSTILDFVAIDLEVDDNYVAGFLTFEPELGLTPYKGIHAVPPAHRICAREGCLTIERFWGLNPERQIFYKTDSEYEEHFRQLFRSAVRSRLRADGPVWAQLSGGLDSSAIVCMADEILEGGLTQTAKVQTVSHVYGQSRSSDEQAFILSVEEALRIKGHHLQEEDCAPLSSFPSDSQLSFPDFLDCFVARQDALAAAMSTAGARVLLTGHGGDQVLCSTETSAPELADLAFRLHFRMLNSRARTWARATKKSYFQLLKEAAAMLLPEHFGIWRYDANYKLPPWLNQKFVAQMDLTRLNQAPKDVFGFRLPSGRDQARWFLSAVRFISLASYRARACIEVSHPYLDRPLVEFLQAIPADQRIRPGETRSLMRRALQDLLPPKIMHRKTKRGPEEAFFRAVAREWPRLQPLFSDAQVCARGYMDRKALLTALERARHGCEQHSFALIKTIALEFWLRALSQRSSALEKVATA